jgi:ABC-2 type transport system ATP-binding protein
MVAAVNISQVDKSFGNLHALSEVNFEIPKGSFFGLLGPNGAGKSTLINIMAGLAHASSGSVSIMGYDVRRNWRQARQSLGVVPQELVIDPFFTVSEMLRLQAGYFGCRSSSAWIEELLHTLNLSDKANTNLQELSGGMKRRVLIAQALVHKPDVVVLDEPTAGVDVELRQVLWKFIKQLHQNGHTIVLTTHYLEEAEALCDQLAIINNGKLVAFDTKKALLARASDRFLCISLNNADISNLPSLIKSKVESFVDNQLVLRLHKIQDEIGFILESLLAANIRFSDLHIKDASLEDVFISLTAKEKS